jgi:hypothetical protein
MVEVVPPTPALMSYDEGDVVYLLDLSAPAAEGDDGSGDERVNEPRPR